MLDQISFSKNISLSVHLKGNFVVLEKNFKLQILIFTIFMRKLYKLRHIYCFCK